ncbi:MAG TPA: DMT family transporter [Devosia sp.]|nr:DMT family transporter [Devosia sp.]
MADTAKTSESRPLLGIMLVVLATLAFASADTTTKHLAALYPAPVIVAIRYLVNVLLLVVFLGPRLGPRLWQVTRLWLVLARALCLAIAAITMALALRLMPVGEAIAIVYLAPILVMLLAMPILGERVSGIGWIGAAFGFIGVLLIARPGGNLDPLGVTFVLINAAVSTGYHLLTRMLSRTETTIAMLFHTAWLGAAIFCVLSIPEFPMPLPPTADIGLMLLVGVLMTLGHFLFTAAYREAPAAQLAPVNYVHLLWAGGLGWLVFGHIPDGWALVGMALVAGAGIVVALSTHLKQRREKDEAAVPIVE